MKCAFDKCLFIKRNTNKIKWKEIVHLCVKYKSSLWMYLAQLNSGISCKSWHNYMSGATIKAVKNKT